MRLSLLTLLHLLALVSAWGQLGHRTVALLSTRFLLPETARTVRTLLLKRTIISAATWPDYFSHTPEGRYTAPWHWIDAHDSPPSVCSVRYKRDCSGKAGCIVSALTNSTARVQAQDASDEERQFALTFIVHLMGDIHQPLHTEDLKRGGNGVEVVFEGKETNLHHVWDSGISDRLLGGNSVVHAVRWTDRLEGEVLGGRWANETLEEWSACLDPGTAEECALEWASGSNRIICEYVLKGYPEALNGTDLAGEYYEGAVGIVEEQVVKAAWRLAGYLNRIFAGSEGSVEVLERRRREREGIWGRVKVGLRYLLPIRAGEL